MAYVTDGEAERIAGYRQQQAATARGQHSTADAKPIYGPFPPSSQPVAPPVAQPDPFQNFVDPYGTQDIIAGPAAPAAPQYGPFLPEPAWTDFGGGQGGYVEPGTGNIWSDGLWYDPDNGSVWNEPFGGWQTPQEYTDYWSGLQQHEAAFPYPDAGEMYSLGSSWSPLAPGYDLDFERPSPILEEPPRYDPRGAAFQASQRSESNPFLGAVGDAFDAYEGFLERYALPGTQESRQRGIEEQGGLGAMLQRPAMGLVAGNQNIAGLTFGQFNPEELPYGLGYVTDALAAPINWAAVAAGPSAPVIGSTLGGSLGKRIAGEVGIDIGARLLGEQAAGDVGESIPLFGEQPAWLRGLEGGLIGGLGAAGAIKGADVGIPALKGYLDEPIEVAPGQFVTRGEFGGGKFGPVEPEPPKLREPEFTADQLERFYSAPEEQLQALLDYTSTDYRQVSDYLRGKAPKSRQAADIIDGLDELFALADPQPSHSVLYRGLILEHPTELAGTTVRDNGFVSASLREGPALDYALSERKGYYGEPLLVELRVPAGESLVPVHQIMSQSGDGEILIDRGRWFRYGTPEKGPDGLWRVTAELVDGPNAPSRFAEPPKPPALTQPGDALQEQIRFRDLIDSETGSVNIGMFAEAGPVTRKRILDQLADRATREGRPTGGIYDDILPTEKVETGIIRTYEGRTGTAGLELQRDLDNGNRLLQDLGIGRRNGRLVNVERTPEVEQLFRALHGEGPVPPRLQQVYDDVKRMIAEESEATLRDNPEFVMKDDYFYRGWRAPKETKAGVGRGQVGAKPGYQKPRVDATFSELLDEGWEPLSWNPYEMAALRRNAGVQFREQKQLVEAFKKTGLAVAVDAATPDGYRVPRIGPAFEGKPFAFIPGAEPLSDAVGARVGYTPRYAVPNKVADQLENIFGRKPDSGAFLGAWAKGNAKLKQFKLLFSLFQQVDFATRQGAAGFAGAVDDLLAGKPFAAVRKAITIPIDSARLFTANVSGARQASLRESILSPKPLFKERPGVSLRSISDAGWSTSDISIINTSIKRALDDIAEGGSVGQVKGALRRVGGEGRITGAPLRRLKSLNEASQKGLFEGVYPQAQATALRKFIVPRIMRQHPDWTDAQVSAAAATEVNKMFSTLGNFQQVIKNPVSKEFIGSLVFSTNETESLLKQAASTFVGPNKRLWTEYYLGGFVFLAAVANLVHYAATGEPLPLERYKPIKKDGYGPLPIGYNSQFLSPQVPGLRGRNNTPIDLDLMGQMDTVFRLLDPQGFIESRENVGLRALQSQQSGEDFFGRPLKGPKERVGQLMADLAEPIGVSQLRGALDIGPEGEGRLGNIGQALQSTGINLRGETTAAMKDRKAAEYYHGAKWSDLTKDQRDELVAKDAELRNELEARRDEAVESGQQWAINQKAVADATQQAMAFQMGSDQRLLRGELTPQEWRDDLSDRLLELRTIKGTIYGNAGTKQGEDPVLDAYFKAMDDAVRKDDGTFDEAKFGAYLDTLSQKDLNYIASQTGVSLNTPLVQQWRQDVKLLSDSGYFDAENKVAVRRADPEIAAAVRRWGYSEMSVKAEDTVLKYTAQQEVDDRSLAQGAITPKQWRDSYNTRRDKLRAEKDGIYAGMKDDGVSTEPLDQYFKEIEKAVEPNGNNIDWQQVDEWVAQQPADVQEVINSYASPGLTPVVDQYRSDVKKIVETGYWDLDDAVTQIWAESMGFKWEEGQTAERFWQEVNSEVVDLFKSEGFSTLEAQAMAGVAMGKLQGKYVDVLGKVKSGLRDANPELARLLVQWGYWEPGKKDTGELLAAGTLR